MDQKSWLWKKKSTEKTLVADKAGNSLGKNEEELTEVQKLTNEKTCLEKDIQILNERLSSSHSDCIAKDNIVKKQVKIAEEAILGWEKAETEAIGLKQELDRVLQQKASSEERVHHLDAALKECMHQLRFVREEQERRVHGALTKSSEDFEKIQIALREQIVEASEKLAKLDAEKAQLSNALSGKDKEIEDLGKYRSRLEADLNTLLLRSEANEKENASLKYEVHVLEKELDIRNEEREFNRRIADVAQKHQHESAIKIAKLESECQGLRLLIQKRLPGPATLAKMRNEVKSLAKDHAEMNQRKSNLSPTSSAEFSSELIPDVSSERINLLTEQLYTMVEENKALKEAINKKSNELQISRNTYARTSSKFSRAAGLIREPLKGQVPAEQGKYPFFVQEHSLAASSEVGSYDKSSCAESCSSALISDLEDLKNEKQLRTPSHSHMATSDMNLMDDFAEMEKLAVLSLDDPAGSPNSSSELSKAVHGSPGIPSSANFSSELARGCVPICDIPSEHVSPKKETHSGCVAGNGTPEKVGDLVKMLLEHSHSSQRNPQDLLEDIKSALANYSLDSSVFCGSASAHHAEASYNGRGANEFSSMENGNNITLSTEEDSGQKVGPNISIPIRKVLELLEGINIHSQDNGTDKNSGNPTGYTVRMFQWKTDEFSAIVQQFVETCNDFLIGTTNLEQFVLQIASSLEWIMSHCFSLQDVSSMKDAIRNHLDWDDSGSESEEQNEAVSHMPNSTNKMEALELSFKEEVKIWNVDWTNKGSAEATGSEGCLRSETSMRECLVIQPQESENENTNLHTEMEGKEQSEGIFGKEKMIKEDLESQLMESNQQRVKACERISLLENELKNKNNCYKGLEKTCHELQIQLKSMASKEVPDGEKHQEKQLSHDWEITAASEKLAECQETILNLGKQLKALASPSSAALLDKVISAPAGSPVAAKNICRQSSLLNKMLAEDNNDTRGASPNSKNEKRNGIVNSGLSTNKATDFSAKYANPNGMNHEQKTKTAVAPMDIVPRKKHGGMSFFKRLFWRRKKGKNSNNHIS
ncbi:filament-like plant protein 7 [Salvia splendens]|uniref:filament-like plant protein 7 n=1 Tax=Salvia splendens TaxID=180675 RepID=UPI0011049CBA|nr:filament-like plant protein 7 [Salvia splendens]XP_042037767.1 filament-like plant protein 7 [Salvia splendens]